MKTFKTMNELKENAVYEVLDNYDIDKIKEWLENEGAVTMMSHYEAIKILKNQIEDESICSYNTSSLYKCSKEIFNNLDYVTFEKIVKPLQENYNVDALLEIVDTEELAEDHISMYGIGHALNYYDVIYYDGNHINVNYMNYDYIICGYYE